MYDKYVESCARQTSAAESDADSPRFILAKEHVYHHIFNYEFNLKFHKPKQNRCDTCELYRMKKEGTKYQRQAVLDDVQSDARISACILV